MYEISRQAMMKQLAAQADERWRSTPSFLDSPARQQPHPATGSNEQDANTLTTEWDKHEGTASDSYNQAGVQEISEGVDAKNDRGRNQEKTRSTDEAPWAKTIRTGAPSEKWQPESWSPGVVSRRRYST